MSEASPTAERDEEIDRFRLLVDRVADYAIFFVDPAGRIASWNDGAAAITGYSAGEIVGSPLGVLYTDDDRAAGVPEHELAAALRDGSVAGESWRVRHDGERFWAEASTTALRDDGGRLIGFARVTRDATEEHRALEKLRHSEETVRRMVEAVRDYAIFMLDPNGFVTSWNPGAERMNGYRAEEIVGRHFSTFYTDEARRRRHPDEELRRARAEGRYEEEGWRIRKDGSRFWASVTISAIVDEDGVLRGFTKVTRDATERRRMQQEAVDAEKRAFEERMRALDAQGAVRLRDEFISVAAHELRTPLTALQLKLQGAAQAASRITEAAVVAARITGALRNVARLSSLVDRLLDVSRILTGRIELHLEETELNDIVAGVVDDLAESAARAGSALTLERADEIVGRWDRARVEQVLLNIVGNAIKYGGGQPIEVRVVGGWPNAKVVVVDHGIGIADADVDRIFGRFERAVSDQHYGGLGLGLYVARTIVDAHGGRISVASRPGFGSTFTVELPLG